MPTAIVCNSPLSCNESQKFCPIKFNLNVQGIDFDEGNVVSEGDLGCSLGVTSCCFCLGYSVHVCIMLGLLENGHVPHSF